MLLPFVVAVLYNTRGKGCVPVGALVFNISGRRFKSGCGGFDSHAFPPRSAILALCIHGLWTRSRRTVAAAQDAQAYRAAY